MQDRTKRQFGAGTLLLAAGLLSRETLTWAWNRLLDVIASPFDKGGGMTMGASPFPWANTAAIALTLIGFWLIFSSYRKRESVVIPNLASIKDVIYVANIVADVQHLLDEHIIRFCLTTFNGSNKELLVNKISGTNSL
jgi:hypothetical protein